MIQIFIYFIAQFSADYLNDKIKENKGNNLVVEILTKIDDTKMKHIFYFIAFIVFAIIFFVLALLGKQEAFNVLQPATNLMK